MKNCVPSSQGQASNQSVGKSQQGTSLNNMAAGGGGVNSNQANFTSGIVVSLSNNEDQGHLDAQHQSQSSQREHEICRDDSIPENMQNGTVLSALSSIEGCKMTFSEMYSQVFNEGQITCFKRPRLGNMLHPIEV